MLIVVVSVQVKADCVEDFKRATIENAESSSKEPGIARFDVIQASADPTSFALIEVYRTPDAPMAHKETEHYKAWRDAVEPMMETPRSSTKFSNVFPDDSGW